MAAHSIRRQRARRAVRRGTARGHRATAHGAHGRL